MIYLCLLTVDYTLRVWNKYIYSMTVFSLSLNVSHSIHESEFGLGQPEQWNVKYSSQKYWTTSNTAINCNTVLHLATNGMS